MIKKGLCKSNPFNSKHPLAKSEKEFLKNSLSEHGMIGVFTLIPDYKEPGKYIILDGHDRIDMTPGDEIEAFIYQKPITRDSELKKLSLDYITSAKKQNKKQLYSFYEDLDLINIEVYKNEFFENINIDVEKLNFDSNFKDKFYEIKTFVFKNEKAFEIYNLLYKKLKDKIFTSPKYLKMIEDKIDSLNTDDFESYFFDFVFTDNIK
jgi:hypothetical protein